MLFPQLFGVNRRVEGEGFCCSSGSDGAVQLILAAVWLEGAAGQAGNAARLAGHSGDRLWGQLQRRSQLQDCWLKEFFFK